MGVTQAQTEIAIDAPLATVWRVVLDLGAYAAWNPFIVRADGPPGALRVGSRLTLTVRWRDGGTERSGERVVRLVHPDAASPGRRAALLAYDYTGPLSALGLVRARRFQTLEQAPGGPTLYRTDEQFRGLLTGALPLAKVQDGFERHARALKARAEAG